MAVLIFATVFPVFSQAQTPESTAQQATKIYANSQAGIEEQFSDILAVVRTKDEPSIRKALDTLGIADAQGWIASHFAAEQVSQEQVEYREAVEKFKSHVWWVTGNLGEYPDFALKVRESEKPEPLSDVGFEGLVPRPKDSLEIVNYRFTSSVTDPKLGTPSWVASFIYLDGRFRMVGGTYPFWAESLNGMRGPMSLAAQVIDGRTVQAEAFRNDAKGPGIDAIVHIQVDVGHDGQIKEMKVLSGDTTFVSDAQRYLQESEFHKWPVDTRHPDARAVWDMEVVFFTPKGSISAN